MNKKVILVLAAVGILGTLGVYGMKVYAQWTNRAHYYARLNYDAHTILKEIQVLQEGYFLKHGRYASSIKELVEDSKNPSSRLQENPISYPGLTEDNSFSGSAYFYSIEETSKNDFTAQAKYKGFKRNGDDIWQILKDGSPYPVVTQKYYRKK